jgi:hypothetical protein
MQALLLALALGPAVGLAQQFHEPGNTPPHVANPGKLLTYLLTFLPMLLGTPPRARGPRPAKHHHQDIHVDLEEEREHIKAQVKTDYLDTEAMDDNSLLMQYFRYG